MLLGFYLGMVQLGVYSIAILLSQAVATLVITVNHGVLFRSIRAKDADSIHCIH